ncbi:hypothetical protein Hanom_Chr13g01189381 [Helianthus anomalus]
MGESKTDHYYPPKCPQPSLPTGITSNELCKMEERILQKLKEIELMVKMRYSSQDKNQGELLRPHSEPINIDNTKSTSTSCESISDSHPRVDCAEKDSPSAPTDALIDLSDSTYTFFNNSPDKGNKGWFRLLVSSLGFTLSDNLLRFCTNQKQLRYLRHFSVVPSSKEPPDLNKNLKTDIDNTS